MTPAQVAAAFGVSTARIRRLSIDGRLPYQQSPLGRLYPRAEVEALVADRAEKRRNEKGGRRVHR
jgi:predicted site-specific integrase-resolvase